jgi:hypothetical protein
MLPCVALSSTLVYDAEDVLPCVAAPVLGNSDRESLDVLEGEEVSLQCRSETCTIPIRGTVSRDAVHGESVLFLRPIKLNLYRTVIAL